jgi:hypothetical protein
MAIADHISPREAVRANLREHFRELSDAAIERIDVDAPLDPEAPGELDADGEPAKLWQNVPVLTVKSLETILRAVFEGPLPPPSERTAEASTPALVIISAVCPRCQMPARIPLGVDVELHQDRDGETLHLKAKSKEAIHTCGQMQLPESGEEMEQTSFDLDDIGPVPTAVELATLLALVFTEIPINHQPNLEPTKFAATVEGWNDATCREVADWAAAVHLAASDNDVVVPPLPEVLGGAPRDPEPTEDSEDETEEEDEPDAGDDLLPA